jgi:hypothetical protein
VFPLNVISVVAEVLNTIVIFADWVVGRGITTTATAVNVPVVVWEGRAQTKEVPLDERTWPAVPTAERPVPPDAVGTTATLTKFFVASVKIGCEAVRPVRFSDVPVAAPMVGVTRVGDEARTLLPVPVDANHEVTVPFEDSTVFAAPKGPVPPLASGRGVPERVIANVPDVAIGEPAIDRNAGTDAATEVTVPVVGVCQTRDVPFEVRTWFAVPTVGRPVPPEVVGSAVVNARLAAEIAPVTANGPEGLVTVNGAASLFVIMNLLFAVTLIS